MGCASIKKPKKQEQIKTLQQSIPNQVQNQQNLQTQNSLLKKRKPQYTLIVTGSCYVSNQIGDRNNQQTNQYTGQGQSTNIVIESKQNEQQQNILNYNECINESFENSKYQDYSSQKRSSEYSNKKISGEFSSQNQMNSNPTYRNLKIKDGQG